MASHRSLLDRIAAGFAIVLGLAVFLVRLRHGGPYSFPMGGALFGALCMIGLGAWLLRAEITRRARWIAGGLAILPLFMALYGFLAEWEEVVVLYANDLQGRERSLRLWIVDDEGGSWLAMPREKAHAHGLTDVELPMLRDGHRRCVRVERSDAYADLVRTAKLRDEKYAVQRLAKRVGVFAAEAPRTSVALRVSECAAGHRDEASP